MKNCCTTTSCLVFFFAASAVLPAQTPSVKFAAPACNNEDFEGSPGGAVTSTNGLAGWSVFKLVPPVSPPNDNCFLFASSNVTRVNPTAVTLFTANGLIDTLVGTAYPIHSVFGSGPSNGGQVYNPLLGPMYGNNFLRLGDASGTSYNHHCLEKTLSVTAANALFRFAYLSVVKTGVTCCEAPSVRMGFFNASGGYSLLPCPVYSITAPTAGCFNVNGPLLTATSNTSSTSQGTYYHTWRVSAVDLSPYIGSQILFRVVVTYCSGGCTKHGYCYLDAQCGPMEIRVNNIVFPANTNSVTFSACGVQQATVVAPPDFSTYQWNGPAGFSSTLSTITTSAAGVYTLNIQTAGTCSTITKYVALNLYPAPTVSIVPSVSVTCPGKPVKLTASGLTTFSWTVPGNTASVSVSPSVTTTYTVSGYDANGCFGSAVFTHSVAKCLGLNDAAPEEAVLVYPNPSQGEFSVQLPAADATAVVELYNALGALCLRQGLTQALTLVTTGDLPRGIYTCTVRRSGVPVLHTRLDLR